MKQMTSQFRSRAIKVSSIAIASGSLFLVPFENAQRLEGQVHMDPPPLRLGSTQPGDVTEVRVAPGALVRAGDVLVVLSDKADQARLQEVQRQIKEANDQQDALARYRVWYEGVVKSQDSQRAIQTPLPCEGYSEAHCEWLTEQYQTFLQHYGNFEFNKQLAGDLISAYESDLKLAKGNLESNSRMLRAIEVGVEKGGISQQSANEFDIKRDNLALAVTEIERKIRELKKSASPVLKGSVFSEGRKSYQTAGAALRARLYNLTLEDKTLRGRLGGRQIMAVADGRVDQVLVQPGETLVPGRVAVVLVNPTARQQVHAVATAEQAADLKPGTQVRIRLQGLRGKVSSVPGTVLRVTSSAATEAQTRQVVVEPLDPLLMKGEMVGDGASAVVYAQLGHQNLTAWVSDWLKGAR